MEFNFIRINENRCDLCGACVGVCPENVMNLSARQLSIDHQGCTRCQRCIWVCPVRALSLVENAVFEQQVVE